jgi:uncharacterized protein
VASDFDKLFGDDWRPQEPESDNPLASHGSSDAARNPSDPEVGETPPDFTSENENLAPRILNEKEVKVLGVWQQHDQGQPAVQHFVLLRDNKGRRVQIWVGHFEALAIQLAIEGEPQDRPMTHELIKLVIERLDATIDRIVIDDLWSDTYYAKVGIVKSNGMALEIDARPSDAIVVALRAKVPIYVAENVLDSHVQPCE